MRPAIKRALAHPTRPDHVVSVFGGQDQEAIEQARKYFEGYAPSSPCVGLLRDGKLLLFLEHSDIEHRDAEDIAPGPHARF